jgi:arylsulfatase A-like enzyme
MNIVLLVVDSLRVCSLGAPPGLGPQTPFLQRLGAETNHFQRAYTTECWTLPAHCSMFTGLLPSEYGAHFQTMAYSAARILSFREPVVTPVRKFFPSLSEHGTS